MVPYKDFGNNGRDNADGQWSLISDGIDAISDLTTHDIYVEWENNTNAYNNYYYYKNLIE